MKKNNEQTLLKRYRTVSDRKNMPRVLYDPLNFDVARQSKLPSLLRHYRKKRSVSVLVRL